MLGVGRTGRRCTGGRGRRRLIAVVALALVAVGCGEQSNLDPDAAVTVRGSARDVDGSPLGSRPVRLGSGVTGAEGGMAVLTLGMFCLGGECTGDFFDTTTADDGSFAFDLTGEDTRSAFGEATSFLLTTSAEPPRDRPTGPGIGARFRIQTTDLVLPPLELVDPRPSVDDEAGDVVVAWDATVAPGPYTVSFSDPDGVPVWQAVTTEATSRADGRVLEDLAGRVTVSGSRKGQVEGSELDIEWLSSSAAFHGGFGPPPSRGAPCELHAADGTTEQVERCPLTDGSNRRAGVPAMVCTGRDDVDQPGSAQPGSEQPAPPPTEDCVTASRVRIRLVDPIPADLVVVRGCADPCRVAVVHDRSTAPADVGAVGAPFAAVSLDGTMVTAVDVVTDDVSALAEVAVWVPQPASPSLLVVEDPAGLGPTQPERDASSDDRWRIAVVVIAALSILAVGVLLGMRIGRRPHPAGGE